MPELATVTGETPESTAVAPAIPRGERWAAIGLTTVAALVVLLTSKDLWFFSDVWPTLTTRPLTTFGGWTKPHGGHWLIPATVGSKVSLHLFEQEFYPWYFLPRVVLYGGLAYAWWRVLRWRQVPQSVALMTAVFISWLGTSGWIITVVYIGPIVVGLCALGSAWIIDEAEPTPRRQVELFVLLAIAVSGSASGPALWAAVFLVALVSRRLRAFAAPIAASGLLYAWWYLTIARNDPSPLTPRVPGLGDILGAPRGMARLIGSGLAQPFRLGDEWKYVAFAAFVVAVVALWRAGRFRRFDAVILTTGVIIVALGVLVRGAQGIRVDAPNRVYLVAAYLLIGILPALFSSLPKQSRLPIAGLLGLLAIVNLAMVIDEIDERESYMSADRLKIETALALIERGDELIPWAGVSPQAANRSLGVLVDRGWQGEIHPEVLETVQSEVLVALYATQAPQGVGLSTAALVSEDGCLEMAGATPYLFEIQGPGGVLLLDAADEALAIERTGAVTFAISKSIQLAQQGIAYSPGPSGQNAMTLTGGWGSDETRILCGVVPAS